MKKDIALLMLFAAIFVVGCNQENKFVDKGFPVSHSDAADEAQQEGMSDSLKIETRSSGVVMTGNPNIRLASIYMVNTIQKTGEKFIGSNGFHHGYSEESDGPGNQWNYHLMPGFEALYGYNLVNVAHHDIASNKASKFFEKPVLIKTFYFPTFSNDTLNSKPISRNYFLVSAYDADTNKDGILNLKDLRKLYFFDINAANKSQLIPPNYSVYGSQYDSANDFMFIYAKQDVNSNGSIDKDEPSSTFYIDLKNPVAAVKMFE